MPIPAFGALEQFGMGPSQSSATSGGPLNVNTPFAVGRGASAGGLSQSTWLMIGAAALAAYLILRKGKK
ncbi:MAG: hypothetical protein AAFW82_03220 [Pseudomonadota bacterium]